MNNKARKDGMAIRLAALIALLMVAGGVTAFGYSQNLTNNGVVWNYGYEGDTYPTNEFPFGGSKWNEDPQGTNSIFSFTTTGNTTNGFVNDMSSGPNGMGFRLSQNATTFPSTNIWTFEFRMRILSSNNNFVGGLEVRQPAFASGFALRIATNTVELAASGGVGGTVSTAFPVGNDWNVYRITLVGSNSALYINTNHAPILATDGARGAGTTIEFGDFGAIGAGSTELDYLRWTFGQAVGDAPIPEPGTATLLMVGGLAALLRRRARQ